MPADPRPSTADYMEFAKGEAEDQAWVVQRLPFVVTPGGRQEHIVRTLEWSRLEPDVVSMKFYARGLGHRQGEGHRRRRRALLAGLVDPRCVEGPDRARVLRIRQGRRGAGPARVMAQGDHLASARPMRLAGDELSDDPRSGVGGVVVDGRRVAGVDGLPDKVQTRRCRPGGSCPPGRRRRCPGTSEGARRGSAAARARWSARRTRPSYRRPGTDDNAGTKLGKPRWMSSRRRLMVITNGGPAVHGVRGPDAVARPGQSRGNVKPQVIPGASHVREGGVEPPRPFGHTDLNRARLPIPPLAPEAC